MSISKDEMQEWNKGKKKKVRKRKVSQYKGMKCWNELCNE